MNAQALHARLTPLFESLKQTQQSITRLSKLSTQASPSTSKTEEGEARVDLSAEIHQSLKEEEEELELLRQEVEDQTNISGWVSSSRRRDSGRGKEKADLAAQITRLGEDLKMYALCSGIPRKRLLIEVFVVPALSFEKHNSRPSAALKLQSGKKGSYYLRVSKKATRPGTAVGKAKRNSHRTSCWSMPRVT